MQRLESRTRPDAGGDSEGGVDVTVTSRRPSRASRLLVIAGFSLVASALVPPSPANAAGLGVGGDIAFADAGEILLVDADGGNVLHLADGSTPVWSPSGRDLAYTAIGDPLTVLSSGTQIMAGTNWSWSPGGDSIAWVPEAFPRDVWVTDVGSGISRNLTNGAVEASPASPQWLPDGRSIVFEGTGGIWVAPVSGGPPTHLVAGHAPAVSHGGDRVAYSHMTGPDITVLSTIHVDGSHPTSLATTQSPCSFRRASWSPDDSMIGYAVACGSGPVLQAVDFYVVPAAGGQPTKIGGGSAWRASGPIWSPTGDRVALVDGGWSSWNVTLVNPDGTSPAVLTSLFPSGSCTAAPSWSPDGARLVFEAFTSGCTPPAFPPFPPSDVYVVNRAGGGLVHIGPGRAPAWRPPPYHIGLVDPAQGVWHLNGVASFYYGNPGDVPFMGDWDCDGVDTPGLYRQSDGFVYLRNSNTQGVADTRFFFGNPGDIPLAGDFNGDGCDTVSLYRPSTGQVFIINQLGSDDGGLGAAEFSYYFGNPGDKPFVGDFDGDGIDTVGLHRESTGFVYLRNSHTQGVADVQFYFGNPGDRLVAGDWNEDGTDTVGVFRPGTSMFYLRFSNTQGNADVAFVQGRSWWLPVGGHLGG
jgi:Tol biopolymer transport system component